MSREAAQGTHPTHRENLIAEGGRHGRVPFNRKPSPFLQNVCAGEQGMLFREWRCLVRLPPPVPAIFKQSL
jgi:hypothetical protein